MKKTLANIILLGNFEINWTDRCRYLFEVFIRLGPIALMLDGLNWWWKTNSQFGQFMCTMLIINMVVGAWMHYKAQTFAFKEFLMKNGEIAALVTVVYVVLEMLRLTAGDNLAGEVFKVLIQLMTLLYPASKVLKNIFVISKGKYPPEFLMKKLYNFEKNGDLKKFFSTEGEIDVDNSFEQYKEKLKNEKSNS